MKVSKLKQKWAIELRKQKSIRLELFITECSAKEIETKTEIIKIIEQFIEDLRT